ncbi:hypothetical protein CNMCM8689_006922 [Aspergillus fumigatus]|nr:hypothetical protein CNMCM8689_006922 [Aspergillus fumigatus]KAF4290421.1 hypothetical protein CNMCM8686_001143 [Aspergillus fumigatus]KAJ8174480.1 hypothetical protein LV163_007976 [Aspergillus fumigatus]
MSDTLCGPSNALQNLQKHASVDRTLQQDRLISRRSPSQGFRSQNSSDGVLDPEFAAFESDLAGPSLPNLQHAGPFSAHPHRLPVASHAENVTWAADFQRLHISGPSHPIQQHHGPSATPASAMSQQGWHSEFLKQQQQRQAPTQQHQQYTGGFQPPATDQQHATETFDESAFEAAFEQARADMALQETNATEEKAEPASETIQPDLSTAQEPTEQIKIGSDTIPQIDKNDPLSRVNDADELARTAGQLLDSVSHDQSEKFRKSSFLALMRRIRDREVRIEDDEFRETSQSLHPGGKYYPGGQQQAQRQQTSIPTHQDGPDGVTFGDINRPQVSPSTPDTVESIATSKAAPRDIPNSFLHHSHKLREVAANARNRAVRIPPPPYSLAVPRGSTHEEGQNALETIDDDTAWETCAGASSTPITISIDASINVVGNGNTIMIPSMAGHPQQTPKVSSSMSPESSSSSSSIAPAASEADTLHSIQKQRQARLTEMATAIINTLYDSGRLAPPAEDHEHAPLEIKINTGIKVEGSRNVICVGATARAQSNKSAPMGTDKDRQVILNRKRRALSEPFEAPNSKKNCVQ